MVVFTDFLIELSKHFLLTVLNLLVIIVLHNLLIKEFLKYVPLFCSLLL